LFNNINYTISKKDEIDENYDIIESKTKIMNKLNKYNKNENKYFSV